MHVAGIKLNIESEWDGIVVLSGHESEELYAWHSLWLLCSSQPVELLRCLTSYRNPKIKWLQEFDKEPQTGITSPLCHVITCYIQSTSGSFPTKFRWPLHHQDFLGTMFWGSKSPQNTTDFSCSSLNWCLDILGCYIQLDPCKKTNTKVPKQNTDFPSFGRCQRASTEIQDIKWMTEVIES